MRTKIINKLKELGAKDVTSLILSEHQSEKKDGKRVLRLYKTKKSFIEFSFDYPEYDYFFIGGNYGKPQRQINFQDFINSNFELV